MFIKERLIDLTKNLFHPIPRIPLCDFTAKPAANRTKAEATTAVWD